MSDLQSNIKEMVKRHATAPLEGFLIVLVVCFFICHPAVTLQMTKHLKSIIVNYCYSYCVSLELGVVELLLLLLFFLNVT